MKTKKEDWLSNREYVKHMKLFAKVLYYLGIIKPTRHENFEGNPRQVYCNGHYCAVFSLCWYNPLSYVFCIILYLVFFVLRLLTAFIAPLIVVWGFNRKYVTVNTPFRGEDDEESEEDVFISDEDQDHSDFAV